MSKNIFSFYIKGDLEEESISKIKCDSKEEAIKIFCEQKKLDETEFLELFEVTLYDKG